MRLGGKKFVKPNVELIIIPRGDGEDIILKASAVKNMELFEQLCPTPEPPTRIYPGGRKAKDVSSPEYVQQVSEYSELRFHFIALESLKETTELEWETVDMDRPATWKNFMTELKDSGFSEIEINRIIQGVMNANCLNEDKIEEARQRFLALQQAESEKSSTQEGEPNSTPSGEPAKG